MTDNEFVAAYLARLGLDRPERADAAGLRALHVAHLRHVPFENLDIHLGVTFTLDPAMLGDKILRRERGGFCYELNGLFARLLADLGYRVKLVAARVWDGKEFGPPLDHLVLHVRCLDEPTVWLVDVGFGDHSHFPLRLEPHFSQRDPGGFFEIVPTGEGDTDVFRDGVVQYRLEPRPRALRDFEAMCWYQQTSARSHFTQSPVCTILGEHGRITLSDRRLITTDGATKTERVLTTQELVRTYADLFGIVLDEAPTAPPAAVP